MSTHPANLFLRFFLELFVLGVTGVWGWSLGEEWMRFLYAFGLPMIVAVVWGVFAVPNDPSRSGKTVVTTPRWLRLMIELAVFGLGFYALMSLGFERAAWVYAAVVTLHYGASYDRIRWLLRMDSD
jgi:hypothetical protein